MKFLIASLCFLNITLNAENCTCLDLNENKYIAKELSNALEDCIVNIPAIENLHGIPILIWGWAAPSEYEQKREASDFYYFKVFNSYSWVGISDLFAILSKDVDQEYQRLSSYYEKKLATFCTRQRISESCIPYLESNLANIPFQKATADILIDQAESFFLERLSDSIEYCKKRHDNPMTLYQSGCLNFATGRSLEAIDDAIKFINLSEKVDEKELLSSMYFQLGESYNEILAFDEAIIALTRALEKNPNNKNAYFERAVSYFEKGDFDKALSDYIDSDIHSKRVDTSLLDKFTFATGISKGIINGSLISAQDFFPSLLSSTYGIGQALWAFGKDPVLASSEFVESMISCLDYLKSNSKIEVVKKIVPELRELIDGWDIFEPFQRGEKTGYVIGKYGVDIFGTIGAVKGVNAYRKLKNSNNLLTLESLAISERNRAIISAEATKKAFARKQILQNANLKIQWDKQGKHIVDHKNFQKTLNKSIFEHPDPQKLIKEFSGKGLKVGNNRPGTSGYKEIVNFEEFIGYSIDRETGLKTRTSWGTIHYAEDGVHIVPTKPRG